MENRVQQKMPPKALVLAAVVLTSASSILIRNISMPALAISFYRLLAATLVLAVPVAAKGKAPLAALTRQDVLLCLFSGVALGFHFATWISSLSLTSVAVSTVLVCCSPLLVALLQFLLFRQRLNPRLLLCLAVAMAGIVLVSFGGGAGGAGSLEGNLLALAGAFFFAVYIMIGARVRQKLSTILYSTLVYSAATLTLLLCCLVSQTPLWGYAPGGYALTVVLGVVCSVGGHTLYNLMQPYGALFISLATLLEPVFAGAMAAVLFAELPAPQALAGAALILGGLAVYLLGEGRRSKEKTRR